jgi:hypothetical protein
MHTIVITRTYVIKGEEGEQYEDTLNRFREIENEIDFLHQEEWLAIENSK